MLARFTAPSRHRLRLSLLVGLRLLVRVSNFAPAAHVQTRDVPSSLLPSTYRLVAPMISTANEIYNTAYLRLTE